MPMPMLRRPFLAALATPMLAHAQAAWPSRAIRIVVPYAPGGGSDVTARLIAPGLQAALGVSIIIENRPGAAGLVGTDLVAHAPADGYSLVLVDMPHTIVPAMQPRMPYDAIADFAPVSLLGTAPMVLFATPALPVDDAAGFAALARAEPERFSIASGGNGSTTHLMAALFQRVTGCRLVHVPYRGSGPAIQDLAAGQVQVSFTTMLTATPFLQNAGIKALGSAGAARLPELLATATFREQGIDLLAEHWWGLLAPARTPPEVVEKLAAATVAVMREPALAPRLAQVGLLPRAEGPAPFAALLRADLARWGQVVREANIRLD